MELLRMKEVMEILKISKSKAYELAREKGFPAFRIGNTIRVPKEELEKWVRKQA